MCSKVATLSALESVQTELRVFSKIIYWGVFMPITTFRKKALCVGLLTALAVPTVSFAHSRDRDRDRDDDDEKKIYIMHTGDLHGDTSSHPNDRGDATGLLEGGLARAATVIKKLKAKHKGKIIWGHTGDSIHGSALATYTQGKAMVDIWDALGPDVFATGNWEYVYGLYRYQQLFGTDADIKKIEPEEYGAMFMIPEDPSGNVYRGFNEDTAFKTSSDGERRRYRTIAANAYYNGSDPGPGVVAKGAGELFTDPYHVQTVNGIKIGFIGCTTNRGPQVVSSRVTWGLSFTNCNGGVKFPQNKPIQWTSTDHPNRDTAAEKLDKTGGTRPHEGSTVKFRTVGEIAKFTEILRATEGSDTRFTNSATGQAWKGEGVDLVVVMSEAGIPESLWNAEATVMPEGVRYPEIVLSSDTHERTRLPVVATNADGVNKTVIIEEGEDAMQVGLLELEFKNGKLKEWEWERYDIDETVPEDSEIADLVKDAEAPFTSVAGGGTWQEGDSFENPFSGYNLNVPFDHVIGHTDVVLERNRFSYEHDTANLKMPADIEGTLHDIYADTFRAMSGSDAGEIRGFRYNNTIMPGNITVKDAYHSLTIGAMIAQGIIPSSPEAENGAPFGEPGKCLTTGADRFDNRINKCHFLGWPRSLVQTFELSGNGTQQPNIPGWSGGWFFNYSGVNFDLDVFQPNFDKYGSKKRSRVSNVRMVDPITGEALHAEGDLPANITMGAYYYFADFNRINRNQIVTGGYCAKKGFGGLTTQCADTKMHVVAKVGNGYGDQIAWVSVSQFAARKAGEYDVYPLDVVEAFGRYVSGGDIKILDLTGKTGVAVREVTVKGLGGNVDKTAFAKTFPRINLLRELPDGRDEFGFGVIQPMRGATDTPKYGPVDSPDDEGDF